MICALAPGRLAGTEMVGKSTCGSGETGSTVKAMRPAMAIATVSRVVATGRRMKGAEMFMRCPAGCWLCGVAGFRLAERENRCARLSKKI